MLALKEHTYTIYATYDTNYTTQTYTIKNVQPDSCLSENNQDVYSTTNFYKKLSADLCEALPDVKSFSVTNLKYMKYFYELYPNAENHPQAVDNSGQPQNRPQAVDDSEKNGFLHPVGT